MPYRLKELTNIVGWSAACPPLQSHLTDTEAKHFSIQNVGIVGVIKVPVLGRDLGDNQPDENCVGIQVFGDHALLKMFTDGPNVVSSAAFVSACSAT